jgi:hypothetical protein
MYSQSQNATFQEKGLKQYVLREYGSWGVMILSYLTGLAVSGRTTAGALTVFIALSLYINSKQAFVLWMRRRGETPSISLAIFAVQVLAATVMLLTVLRASLGLLMSYALAPLVYLLCLKFLGEHLLFTEISGFVLLSLSALLAKLATTGVLDPALFAAVAIFFTAGVFKVRVRFRKDILHRALMVIYIGFALLVYRLISVPVLVLIPLIDNLVFSITLYQAKLRSTGWLEVLKGIVFLLLMAYSFN